MCKYNNDTENAVLLTKDTIHDTSFITEKKLIYFYDYDNTMEIEDWVILTGDNACAQNVCEFSLKTTVVQCVLYEIFKLANGRFHYSHS